MKKNKSITSYLYKKINYSTSEINMTSFVLMSSFQRVDIASPMARNEWE